MRKIFAALILLFITTPCLAQIEGISNDSIPFYLSKKWKEKARFLDKQQIAIFGDPMEYEFKDDRSFIKNYDKEIKRGSWIYDSDKKVIQLLIGSETNFYVVALTKKELLLSADLREGADKGTGILVLLHAVE